MNPFHPMYDPPPSAYVGYKRAHQIEATLAKQRVVNEALLEALEWFKAEGYNYAVLEKLSTALREAIKPKDLTDETPYRESRPVTTSSR